MPLATVDRRARAATTLIFFLTGFVYAAWATRIPVIKADLGLSAGALGVAVLGLGAGGTAGPPAGAALTARAGSRTALRVGFAAYPAALVGVALAPGLTALTVALAAMAVGSSVVDVAMNAHGIELERRYRRPLLSGLHAGHPFGLVAGGLLGSAAAAGGVSVTAHLGAVAVAGLAAGLGATCWLVRDRDLCGAALAFAAFTLFSLTLAVGRLFGDRLVERLGRVRVVRGCGAVAAAGSLLAIAAPAAGGSLAGWALFGLGLAALAPTVLGAAPSAGRGSAAAAIAAVTTVGYLGSFTRPPPRGALAEAGGLSAPPGPLVLL